MRSKAGNAQSGLREGPSPSCSRISTASASAGRSSSSCRDLPAAASGQQRQLVRRRGAERGLGAAGLRRAGCRAALGARSRSACGWTSRTRWRRGGSTWPGSTPVRRADGASGPMGSTTAARAPISRSGCLPTARWGSARFRTAGGIDYVANMPTEEIFTTPDSHRAEGTIRSSLPLSLSGQIIRGLELTFEDGRIVECRGRDRRRSRPQPAGHDRECRPARRARARHERVACRPDGDALLQHAVRRERHVPHRVRIRLPYAFDGEPDGG